MEAYVSEGAVSFPAEFLVLTITRDDGMEYLFSLGLDPEGPVDAVRARPPQEYYKGSFRLPSGITLRTPFSLVLEQEGEKLLLPGCEITAVEARVSGTRVRFNCTQRRSD